MVSLSFQEFLNKYNGQQNVGNTTENTGQCVGLVAVWVDALSLPHIWGNACDLFVNANEKFFTKILNTPDAIPQAGDIIVWSAKFNGTVGHTGIATGTADINTFECFEQNDPLKSNCHLKTYNYNFVTGWLRPKVSSVGVDPVILAQSDAFIAICTKLNLPANRDIVLADLDKLITMQDAVMQKDKQIQDAQTQITNLGTTLSQKDTELKQLQDDLALLTAQTNNAVQSNKELTEQVAELKKTCLPQPVFTGWRKAIYNMLLKN